MPSLVVSKNNSRAKPQGERAREIHIGRESKRDLDSLEYGWLGYSGAWWCWCGPKSPTPPSRRGQKTPYSLPQSWHLRSSL